MAPDPKHRACCGYAPLTAKAACSLWTSFEHSVIILDAHVHRKGESGRDEREETRGQQLGDTGVLPAGQGKGVRVIS